MPDRPSVLFLLPFSLGLTTKCMFYSSSFGIVFVLLSVTPNTELQMTGKLSKECTIQEVVKEAFAEYSKLEP